MLRFVKRWADSALQSEIARLRIELADTTSELESQRRKTAVVESERDVLAAVNERNRQRVLAESSAATRQCVENETRPPHGRDITG